MSADDTLVAAVNDAPGLTIAEYAIRLRWRSQSVSALMRKAERMNLVKREGMRNLKGGSFGAPMWFPVEMTGAPQ